MHRIRTPRRGMLPLLVTLVLSAAMLVAGWARAAEEVNIYSFRQPFLLEPLLDAFARETGIRANVVYAPKGMLERLKQEGMNSPADVVMTVDIGRLYDAVQADVLQPVRSDVLEQNIPPAYRGSEGRWFALTLRARVIYASRERVEPSELSTYEALAEPQWKGRICMRSSQHDYNIALMAAMIAHHGEDYAEEWARGLLANQARKPQGNDRAQVKAIKEGVCDVALGNSYYMGKMLTDPEQVAWAKAVYLHFPNQATYGTHVNISGAGVTKAAPNRANAVKLLEFLSSPLAQKMYAEVNFEYPANPAVPWSGMVESWGAYEADDLPLERIAKLREEAILIFDRVGFP